MAQPPPCSHPPRNPRARPERYPRACWSRLVGGRRELALDGPWVASGAGGSCLSGDPLCARGESLLWGVCRKPSSESWSPMPRGWLQSVGPIPLLAQTPLGLLSAPWCSFWGGRVDAGQGRSPASPQLCVRPSRATVGTVSGLYRWPGDTPGPACDGPGSRRLGDTCSRAPWRAGVSPPLCGLLIEALRLPL